MSSIKENQENRENQENLPDWSIFFEARDRAASYPWQIIDAGNKKAIEGMRERRLNIEEYRQPHRRYSEELDTARYKLAINRFELRYSVAQRLRAVFEKSGNARYIGHIDFTEVIRRGLRMANIPVAFTRGFNKRERISCGFPVPIGVESIAEIVDIELYEKLTAEDIGRLIDKLNGYLPDFIKATDIAEREDKLTIMAMTNAIEYRVKFYDAGCIPEIISFLNSNETFTKVGKKGERRYPLNDILHSYKADEESITLILYIGNESSVRIDEFLKAVTGEQDIYASGISVLKLGQILSPLQQLPSKL
jgi:radical SAM-linked protein